MNRNCSAARKREARLVGVQALLVTVAVLALLVVLFDFLPPEPPSAVGNLGKVTLLNLGNPSLPRRDALARWLEVHDPGLFSRSDTRHGYLRFLPATSRPVPPGALEVELPPNPVRPYPGPPAFQPLTRLDSRVTEFRAYPVGALPPPPPGAEPKIGGIRVEWSKPNPPEVDFSAAAKAGGAGATELRVLRSAECPEALHFEVRSGGSTARNPLIWSALSESMTDFLAPGETVTLVIHWPPEAVHPHKESAP